ncbi:origin recognition complex subunit 6 [Ctenocephalides felis]|uniref:origin recognition complex subunit 6 n=1 Tax=Ctenocephalides felis TaxID=7515 RepID=UPI000E6E2EA8|nr:origin recognition complex subunit 6 [Ctenocephalides felis]
MVSAENEMVHMMAQKLGFEENTQLINKANELLRLLKLKSLGGNSITLTGLAQAVICLDLASSFLGTSFDSDYALKLSGFKKSTYLNSLRTIEKLLDLSKDLTISELCVQLGVTSVKEKAEILLSKYKTSHDCDISHPQYVAMAVYQACRLSKIKLQKSMIVPFSRIKGSQWTMLEKTWTTWVDEVSPTLFKDAVQNNGDKIAENLGKAIDAGKSDGKQDSEKIEIEDYDVWKKRILEEAYRELEKQKNAMEI